MIDTLAGDRRQAPRNRPCCMRTYASTDQKRGVSESRRFIATDPPRPIFEASGCRNFLPLNMLKMLARGNQHGWTKVLFPLKGKHPSPLDFRHCLHREASAQSRDRVCSKCIVTFIVACCTMSEPGLFLRRLQRLACHGILIIVFVHTTVSNQGHRTTAALDDLSTNSVSRH